MSFSAICSRLSHYLREQQHLASVARPTTTLSLLHELEVSAEAEEETGGVASDSQPLDLGARLAADAVPAVEKSELTIFYGGQMLVFNDFPADKANDLMLMAGKGISVDPPALISGKTGLPLKRSASLHRFMEKRRERIKSSRKPYQMDEPRADSSSKKQMAGLPWFLQSSQNQTRGAADE